MFAHCSQLSCVHGASTNPQCEILETSDIGSRISNPCPNLPCSWDMAPRKRRNRASLPAIPTPDSASNSFITSSPSPHRNSRSEDTESDKLRSKRLSTDHPMSPDVDLPHLLSSQHNHHSHLNQQKPHLRPIVPSQPVREARVVANAAASVSAGVVPPTDRERFTVASVALRLYDQLIDWAVLHFAVQYKHHAFLTAEERRRAGAFPSTGQRSSKISIVPGSCGSRLVFSDKNVNVECSNCHKNVAASRYAHHFEKCLGFGGRTSSRNASARMRASAERAEKDNSADADDAPTRRKRHSNSSSADNDTGASITPLSLSSHKRKKLSPISSAQTASLAQAVLNQRGLPPSGRSSRTSPKWTLVSLPD